MDIRLLKSLLSYEFYNENKTNLSKTLFEDEIQEAYDIIVQAHEKYQHDLIPATTIPYRPELLFSRVTSCR